MNAEEVIQQVQEYASEYIEMTDNPAALVAGILANKVVKLQDYVNYLEKRLNCANEIK